METRILLVFHTSEGQTAKIAERISAKLAKKGATVVEAESDDAPSPTGFDGVIVGDSIHLGRHSRSLRRWLATHESALEGVPTALFQVSLTSAHEDVEHTTEAHRMLQRLIDETGVEPDVVGLFAGALAYTRYGWLKRHMMKRLAESQGDPTDTSTDHEFTDWDAVDEFAADALAVTRSTQAAPM